MSSAPSWLPAFVAHHSAAHVSRGISGPGQGMLLYGTIGHAAYLRADGSVWFQVVDEADQEKDDWVFAVGIERIGALVLGTKRFPELLGLLPERPSGVPDCQRCGGSGEINQIQCPECGGLGWVPEAA